MPPPMPSARTSGMAQVNGVAVYYAIYGEGPPLLLLHGGLASADCWSGQIPAFAAAHEVIVMDSRGHGRSTRDTRPFSYDLMAADVVALLDHLHVARTSIVGWSDGAIIGLDIAIHHPERLDRLFAFGANFAPSGLKPDAERDPVVAAYIERAGKDYARVSPTPRDYDAFVAAISTMWSTQPNFTAEELARITAPTMIADGEYDEMIRRDHTEALARAVPGARLLLMPRVSHFAHWQSPEDYNRTVLAFVDAPTGK